MISRDFLGNTWEYDCLGCAIARQELSVPGGFIRKSGQFCVHQDPLVPVPSFVVIASTRHIQTLADMNEAEYAEFSKLVRQTQAAVKKAVQVESLTLVQEEHSGHFHLWFFPWLPEIIAGYGAPTLTKIRQIMAEVSREPIRTAEWKELEKTIQGIKALIE
jgi:diadenosine tetraphosphate (Ap4A) HIT family hydrolase